VEHKEYRCPSCGSKQLVAHLEVKDHFLSKESFELLKCADCHLLATFPRPSLESIGSYYKSENYISHSSTKKGVVNRVYNFVRNYTLNKKFKLISSLTTGRSLLDVGAGSGHFVKRMQNGGFHVQGLEPDYDARQTALSLNGIELEELALLSTIPAETKDVVTMWHVLEHVYHLNADLDRIVEVLKSDGVLVIAVPNYMSFDATYYQSFWAAYDVPRHLYHFEPDSLIPLIEKKGLRCEQVLPMKFDSYYVSMLSEKYKGGSLMNALRIGWLSNWKDKGGKSSSQIYIFRKK
jgi:2-polyprenyl-3-methyl-5-hydroxy-6-metoxy-1,4-benzoquinol methylase